MLSPFPCNNPVIREYSWKKTQIKEQQKQADRFFPRFWNRTKIWKFDHCRLAKIYQNSIRNSGVQVGKKSFLLKNHGGVLSTI